MNRRNFFKAVAGFIAGVCAVFAPKAKADMLIPLHLFPTEEKAREFSQIRIKPKCSDCPDEDGSEFCEDPTCPYKPTEECSQLGQVPEIDDGLKNAFCYGGKLFRVFRGYLHDDFTMIQLREGKWENRHLLHNFEFANHKYRHRVCEHMIRSLERMKHPVYNYTINKDGLINLLVD